MDEDAGDGDGGKGPANGGHRSSQVEAEPLAFTARPRLLELLAFIELTVTEPLARKSSPRKRLLIVGAGNLGREVLDWALGVPAADRNWEVGGFLDSRESVLDGFGSPVGILGNPLTFELAKSDVLLCAVGDPRTKLDYCLKLRARGGHFITLIHPSATVGSGNRIGEGCMLAPGSVVTTNVTLGDFVSLDVHASVSHDSMVGDGSTLSPHSTVLGNGRLGSGVFLGSHACVLPNATVGEFATVGAGSVVLRHVGPHTTVAGVPTRPLPEKS